MEVKYWIWIIPVAIIIILLAIVSGGGDPVAALYVDAGSVDVTDNGEWRAAVNGEEIDPDASVRTGPNGRATIVLSGNLITQLGPETEVTIAELTEEHITVKQERGSTWNKFINLISGQGATIESPQVIAMVRGTEWGVDDQGIIVASGEVTGIWDEQEFTIYGLQRLHLVEGSPQVEDLTPEELAELKGRMTGTLSAMKKHRLKLLESKKAIVKTAMKMAKIGDDIPTTLERIDSGELDYHSATEKAPSLAKKFRTEIALTDAIAKQAQLLEQLEGENEN